MAPRTPLLRPDRFFAEREPDPRRLLVLLAVVLLVLPAGVFGVGEVFAARIDGTVMVDNPARPSEHFCDTVPDSDAHGCDRPAEVERDVDVPIREAFGGLLGQVLLGSVLLVVGVGLLVHLGAYLGGPEEGGLAESFAVALWGLAPEVVAVAGGLAVLWLTFDPITVTPATEPATLLEEATAQLGALRTAGPVLGGVTAVWGAVIWRFGLVHERGLSGPAATAVAGVIGLLVLLGTLL